MHELFAPQGSNPLANLKVGNPRCSKVEFDRTVRSNVLVIEGDLTQSRVQIPKEDRPMTSLQLNHSLLVLQILIPSSGQFLLELNVSNSPTTRMRLSAATFISRADVVDAKGMAHAKIPLVIPRNCWVQIVFHVGGIFTHLFRLPAVKWIDSVVLAGSCKVRKILTCADESTAIETKPGGMLLFAVPAYGPPVWQTANQASKPPENSSDAAAPDTPQDAGLPADSSQQGGGRNAAVTSRAEISSRTVGAATQGSTPVAKELISAAFAPVTETQSARHPSSKGASPTGFPVDSGSGTPNAAEPTTPVLMRFLRSDDGVVSFTAKNPEQEAREKIERQRQLDIIERLRQEAEQVRIREEMDRHRRQVEAEDAKTHYVRLVEDEAPLTGRRQSNLAGPSGSSNVTQQQGMSNNNTNSSNYPATNGLRRAGTGLGAPAVGASKGVVLTSSIDGDNFGSWGDDDSMFISMLPSGGGGVGSSVMTTYTGGGKPVVVSTARRPDEIAAQAAANAAAAAKAARKPIIPRRNLAGVPSDRKKRPALPPSEMLLTMRAMPGEFHPADDYDPELQRRQEPEVGYGCGFMDIIHGGLDDDDEEDIEEEEEEE